MTTEKRLTESEKLGTGAVYSRLGKALENALAASKALMSEEFKFHGDELNGPVKCKQREAA